MDVIELHGNIRAYRCSAGCTANVYEVPDYAKEAKMPPTCPNCGAYLRPNVVWFGEPLSFESLQRSTELAEDCDVMLIIGTSGLVNPAAALPKIAKSSGATLIDINPTTDEFTSIVDYTLPGKAGTIVPALLNAIRPRA
jgi:NAD-dependent deacetylase